MSERCDKHPMHTHFDTVDEKWTCVRCLLLQNQVLRNAVESAVTFESRVGFEGDITTPEGRALAKLLEDAIAFCDGKLAEKPFHLPEEKPVCRELDDWGHGDVFECG